MAEHVIHGINSDPWNVHTYIIYDTPGEVNIIARTQKDQNNVEVKGLVDINIFTSVETVDIRPSIAVRVFGGRAITMAYRKFDSIFFSIGEKIELDNGQCIEIQAGENKTVAMTMYSSVFWERKFRRVACSVILTEEQLHHIMSVLKSASIFDTYY